MNGVVEEPCTIAAERRGFNELTRRSYKRFTGKSTILPGRRENVSPKTETCLDSQRGFTLRLPKAAFASAWRLQYIFCRIRCTLLTARHSMDWIDHRQLPPSAGGYSALFLRYLYEFDDVRQFYPGNFRENSSYEAVIDKFLFSKNAIID